MKLLNVDQCFHAVGQGLFYSTDFSILAGGSSHTFSFVYDCGSESKGVYLKQEVLRCRKLCLCSGSLDLLVLSHLHKDHVNGLDMLLEGIHTKHVVLPYLDPAERLLLAVSQDATGWYAAFLINPTEYLRNMGVEKIYYITHGEDRRIDPPPKREDNSLEGWELYPAFGNMQNDDQARDKAQDEDNVLKDDVFFKKDAMPVPVSKLWQFLFYVAEIDENKLDCFKRCAHKIIGSGSLVDAINDQKRLEGLKRCYESFSSDFNSTTLSCLHGPLFQKAPIYDSLCSLSCCWPGGLFLPNPKLAPDRLCHDWEDFMYHCCPPHHHLWREYQSLAQNYSQLLGDMNTKKEWNNLKTRYQALFPLIQLIQVPHHGSHKSWSSDICSDLAPCRYVISAGLSNRHGHPDCQIMQDIRKTSSPVGIEWVNEHHSFLSQKQFFFR